MLLHFFGGFRGYQRYMNSPLDLHAKMCTTLHATKLTSSIFTRLTSQLGQLLNMNLWGENCFTSRQYVFAKYGLYKGERGGGMIKYFLLAFSFLISENVIHTTFKISLTEHK